MDKESHELLEEVEFELIKIQNKYTGNDANVIVTNKRNLHSSLHKLSQEFDCLGLSKIDDFKSKTNLLEKLADNTSSLIQIHRKTINQVNDLNISNSQFRSQNINLEKRVNALKDDISRKQQEIEKLRAKVKGLNHELTLIGEEKRILKQELEFSKKTKNSTQREHDHKLNRLKSDNEKLKEKFGKNIGKYVAKDDIVVEQLNKYKNNEEMYKNIIRKLQENNEGLVEEILNLRENEVLSVCNKNNKVN